MHESWSSPARLASSLDVSLGSADLPAEEGEIKSRWLYLDTFPNKYLFGRPMSKMMLSPPRHHIIRVGWRIRSVGFRHGDGDEMDMA
jgi:hypothetical protein